MRWMLYFAAILSLVGQELVVAQKLKLPNPLVVNGETFVNPVYESHDASRLNIMHKTGAASLPIADLPSGLPNKLGYNRSNALAAEEEIEKRQKETEIQSQIELRKMLEKEKAASRRVEKVDRDATRMRQGYLYTHKSNPSAIYSPLPRSSVTRPSTVSGEPLTSTDLIRARWGWGPSPLASAEERERFEASGLNGKTASASHYQSQSTRIVNPSETSKRRGGYAGLVYPDGQSDELSSQSRSERRQYIYERDSFGNVNPVPVGAVRNGQVHGADRFGNISPQPAGIIRRGHIHDADPSRGINPSPSGFVDRAGRIFDKDGETPLIMR